MDSIGDLSSNAELDSVVRDYAYLGVQLETVLRGVLVVFVVLTLLVVPPLHDRPGSYVVALAYAIWAVALGLHTWRRGPRPVRFEWLILLVDLAALGGLTLLAGASAKESWTADVLVYGFFLVPLLAATQVRPEVSALVVAPTAAAYFATSVATKSANQEPWGPIILGTFVLIGIGVGCIGLSYIQRSRVAAIAGLVRDRNNLLDDLMTVEARERQRLSERLHDGALQYVLAARHDLEDARELSELEAFDRLDRALTESASLLRSTVAELHPAVLAQAGLAQALWDLASTAAATGGFSATVDTDGWSDEPRTSADELLFACARELLTNVAKHAQARTVRISLARQGQLARLVIADDGQGIPDGAVERSLGQGHIGLASYHSRVEAAGGSLALRRASPSGTVAEVTVPALAEGAKVS